MYFDNKIWIGDSEGEKVSILPQMANRHGLIAGATGTGKTVTLKVLAESFSDAGVPVFLADVKGDLAGMCRPGVDTEDMQERISRFGLAEDGFGFRSYPVQYWDVYGEKGLPLRTTISEMGPLLLGQILELNETQMDVLSVVFRIADDAGQNAAVPGRRKYVVSETCYYAYRRLESGLEPVDGVRGRIGNGIDYLVVLQKAHKSPVADRT